MSSVIPTKKRKSRDKKFFLPPPPDQKTDRLEKNNYFIVVVVSSCQDIFPQKSKVAGRSSFLLAPSHLLPSRRQTDEKIFYFFYCGGCHLVKASSTKRKSRGTKRSLVPSSSRRSENRRIWKKVFYFVIERLAGVPKGSLYELAKRKRKSRGTKKSSSSALPPLSE